MQDFEHLIAKDGFVEHAEFGGNRYGTSKMTIEEQTKKGRIVLLDIEMEVRNPPRENCRCSVTCPLLLGDRWSGDSSHG